MADPSAIDAAVIAALLADGALMAIATDGVFRDFAPEGMTRFVIVNLQDAHTERVENGIAYEAPVYLVKAVIKGVSGVNLGQSGIDANAAAARIDALLENNGAGGSLTITGYGLITTGRIEDNWRVRYPDPDPMSKETRWEHAGGLYEVWGQPS